MGKKSYAIIMAIVCCMKPIVSCAALPAEVYSVYDKTYDDSEYQEAVSTVLAYNEGKRYAYMYNTLSQASFDVDTLKLQREDCVAKLAELAEQLRSGYTTDQTTLYALEDEYQSVSNTLSDIDSMLSEKFSVIEEVPKVPSYNDYVAAKYFVKAYRSSHNVGNVENMCVPVTTKNKFISVEDNLVTYRVANDATVVSLFNCTVDDVSNDCITLNTCDTIKLYVYNVASVYVNVGDKLNQGDNVCTVKNNILKLKLQLGDEFVDASKLLTEDSLL